MDSKFRNHESYLLYLLKWFTLWVPDLECYECCIISAALDTSCKNQTTVTLWNIYEKTIDNKQWNILHQPNEQSANCRPPTILSITTCTILSLHDTVAVTYSNTAVSPWSHCWKISGWGYSHWLQYAHGRTAHFRSKKEKIKIWANIRPVLLSEGEPGMPQYFPAK